jgi:hypothetical protein
MKNDGHEISLPPISDSLGMLLKLIPACTAHSFCWTPIRNSYKKKRHPGQARDIYRGSLWGAIF